MQIELTPSAEFMRKVLIINWIQIWPLCFGLFQFTPYLLTNVKFSNYRDELRFCLLLRGV